MLTRGTLIYIAQRLVLIAFTVMVVSFGVFVVVHSLPGTAFTSERLHGKALQLLLHEYGLDQPVVIQYWNWLKDAIHGDLGVSLHIRGAPITPIVMQELSVSAMVGGAALLITIGLGVLFGVLAAIRQNTWVDYLLTTLAVIGYSVPSFVLATLFILIFGLWLSDTTNGSFGYPIGWGGTYGNLAELSVP
ncbi:MAG: ABC transporter permease, partial [Chloroflexi bacterium]|nr:ABC transporter permease [Chloroflexota bacterium]